MPNLTVNSVVDTFMQATTLAEMRAAIGLGTIETLTDAATVTPDVDGNIGGLLATLSQTTEFANPTGTPVNGQRYTIRVKSTTTRALTYGSQYRGSADLALPTATSGSSLTDYMVFAWNSADTKWDLLGRTFGF